MHLNQAAKLYQTVATQTSVVNADPHRLVQIMMDYVLEKLIRAKGEMIANHVHDKGLHISEAISVIDALQSSLDLQNGEKIAQNLHELYSYMMSRLLEANLHNQPEKLDEVIELMGTIKESWDQVSAQSKQEQS